MATDTYTLEIAGTVAGQRVANVLHLTGSTTNGNPISGAEALIVAFQAGGGGQTEFLNCCPDNYTLVGFRARRVNNTGGPNVAHPVAPINGNRVGASDMSSMGPCILFHCGEVGGRYITGRLFVPGVSIDDVADNVFDPALVAACNTFTGVLQAGIGAGPEGPFTLVVYNRTLNTFQTLLGGSVSLKPGTQRRRLVPIF